MVVLPKPGRPRPPRDASKPAKPWRERLKDVRTAYGNIPGAFRLVWGADRRSTIVMAALTLISAVLPATQAWVGKLIIDSVIGSINRHTGAWLGLQATLPYLVLEFSLLLASAAISQVRGLAEHVLNARLGHYINSAVIRKALALDLQYFEDASFYDKLQNARREADFRALGIINGGFLVVQNIITLTSFAVALLAFNPLVALLLFGATIPSFIAQNKYSKLQFRMLTWRAPESRRMNYLEHLLTVDNTVKEVKLFGLGEPLLQRYTDMFWKIFEEDEHLARRRSWISVFWGMVASASYYVAYAWVIYEFIAGRIPLGTGLVFYLTLFRSSQGTFQGLFDNINKLYENGLFMDNLFSFLDLAPQMAVAEHPRPMPAKIRQGLALR